MHNHNNASELPADAVIVGIDWADDEHVLCLIEPDSRANISTLQQSPATNGVMIASPLREQGIFARPLPCASLACAAG